MNPIHQLIILSLLSALFGCGSTSTLKKGTFDGQFYTLMNTEHKGFSTNSFDRSVKLGSLPTIAIDASTTDWGPPYSDQLYGKASFVFTAKHRIPYRNELDSDDIHPTNTMLYLSPERFSKPEFDQYVRFMKTEWPGIDAQYATQPGLRSFPHLIGLVHGNRDDFVRIFRGKRQGKPYLFRIEPDGRIRYMEDAAYNNDTYSGLSQRVQMPGRVIYLDLYKTPQTGALTLADLQTYRNDTGKTFTDYFTVIPKKTAN